MAHDIHFTGHLGVTKTKDGIMQRYYWPAIFSDIQTTWYPKAVALPMVIAPRVAKELIQLFA